MNTTVRTLFSVELKKGGVVEPFDEKNLWHIEFVGNGFLYHMVRNITGTLIEIARGRYTKEFLLECLYENKKFKAYVLPHRGLFLVEIKI
jgi:tRNA pseudouridine38-40 synthase